MNEEFTPIDYALRRNDGGTPMIRRAQSQLQRFGRDPRGASAIEYSLLIAGIGVTVMAMINFLSTQIVFVQNQVVQALGG